MSLKDDMVRDIHETFLNAEEFAETRTVAGRKIACVFYEEKPTAGADEMGVAEYSYILQARETDIPKLQAGDTLRIDGQIWGVTDISKDFGMAVIKLTKHG